MDNLAKGIFKNKKVVISKLSDFGFVQDNNEYIFEKALNTSDFKLTVKITADGNISTEIIDPSFNEPYTLHLVENAVGSFVGNIRNEYEEILAEIAEKCFETDVFKSEQAKRIIDYASKKYNNSLEFLWKKFPEYAVLRRTDTNKWYAVLLIIPKNKLGIKSNEPAEILALRAKPEDIENIIDYKKYFPGYHMNKKHWLTIILDGSVDINEIYNKIDESYALAVKQR